MLIALILPAILLALAQDARQVAERFRQVAARFLLDVDDDDEEVGLRHRHPLEQLARRASPSGHAQRLGLDDVRGTRTATGSSASCDDDAEAVAERHAGADAAHDHVHGVRQLLDELLDAALAQEAEDPVRQADSRRRKRPPSRQRSGSPSEGAATSPATTPSTALTMIEGASSSRSGPARAIFVSRVTLSRLLWRASISFRLWPPARGGWRWRARRDRASPLRADQRLDGASRPARSPDSMG